MIVYCITKGDRVVYVGLTKYSAEQRLASHLYGAIKGAKTALAHAIRKYGPESFYIWTLAQCSSVEEMKTTEIRMITELNTRAPNGYNLTAGGDGTSGAHWNLTEETRRKISEANRGRKFSAEHQRRLSEVWHRSEEIIRRIADAHRGKKHSEETRRKIGEAHRGKKHSEETRRKLRMITAGRQIPKETQIKGAQATSHKRWHVNRGIISPTCALCSSPSQEHRDAEREDARTITQT